MFLCAAARRSLSEPWAVSDGNWKWAQKKMEPPAHELPQLATHSKCFMYVKHSGEMLLSHLTYVSRVFSNAACVKAALSCFYRRSVQNALHTALRGYLHF